MLRPTCYVKRLPMFTMNRVFERLERPPLPLDSEAKACNRDPSIHQSHDWDALDGELA